MKLPRPFYKLPLCFDVKTLQKEVENLPTAAWVAHPNGIAGNTALRLITANGTENDLVNGPMLTTQHLRDCPYLQQVLASFSVVWSRSRLLRLAAGAKVPEHADINHHWYYRVRLHIPIFTQPEVTFYCDDQAVHMAAGEAWLFDNWRLHRVENASNADRIHLVADTSGSAEFWRLALNNANDQTAIRTVPFDSKAQNKVLLESVTVPQRMSPAEVELLVADLCTELESQTNAIDSNKKVLKYQYLLDSFSKDWRQLYLLYGESREGQKEFERLIEWVRTASIAQSTDLVMRTNGVSAHKVFEARVLRSAIRNDIRNAV
jgi:hypothetical protein